MIVYTVYKTTNLLNEMFYIGVHKTEEPNDDYLGSGKWIQRAIKKYGVESFKKEILHTFETMEEAFLKEKELVTKEVLDSGKCYNLRLGGEGGWDFVLSDKSLILERNRKISRNRTYQEPKMLEMNRVRCNSDLNPWKGNKTKTNWALDPENQRRASILGIPKRKETFKRIQHQAGEKNSNYGRSWMIHKEAKDISERQIFSKDNFPIDFIPTSEWKRNKKKQNSPNFGKKWFNDGISNFLLTEDMSGLLNRGRLGKLFQNSCKQ